MHTLSSLALASVFLVQVLAASVHPRGLAPPGWESFICLIDCRTTFGLPLLTGPVFADTTGMTIEKCAAFCDSQAVPYRFMGITDGSVCSCDNYFESIFESVSDSSCNTPCPGNPLEVGGCGGKELNNPVASTYRKINATIPALVPSVGLWNGLGCYNDSVSARALQERVEAGNTTVESCVAACQAQGFTLAGLEFGRECWCGPELQHGSRNSGNDNGLDETNSNHRIDPNALNCDMGCQGAPTESCGGSDRLSLYNFTGTYPVGASVVAAAGGWTSRGCYSDSPSMRALERRIDAGNVTVESCVSACQSQSFTIAGLEYAQECWCGNEIMPPRGPTSQRACSQACVGDNTEVCGGPDALQVYF
ncbi:WSC domain-containing protein [Lactarius pseudohatsudake]|nr:WSC domain-containing protein [Lactarius pseudohatsudake]